MEKILISDNWIAAGQAIDQAKEAAVTINQGWIPLFKTIGIPVTQERFRDCFTGGGKTKKLYFETLKADLDKINNPAISGTMREAAVKAWEYFDQVLQNMKYEAKDYYQFMDIVDEMAVVLPEGSERLAQRFRTYSSDPKVIEAHNLHVEITEKLNNLFKGGVPFGWKSIFIEAENGKILRNPETNYPNIVESWKE